MISDVKVKTLKEEIEEKEHKNQYFEDGFQEDEKDEDDVGDDEADEDDMEDDEADEEDDEEINSDDVQKIADIIISEAIDNDFGKEKDDMTVIVAKVC